ncbi:MAG: Hsp20/alpha crystallin family protein [Myxococcales bacterium]|nr:Hsp20/alpha crystallin family protein [Myxococcales bacterium]
MIFRFDDLDRAFDTMNQLHRRLDRVLDSYGLTDRPRAESLGAVDLHETEDALIVTADLPGVRDNDLELSLKEDVLTFIGRRTVEAPEGYRTHLAERRPYEFTRSFALPTRVDPEKVKATLRDGVLTVKLGKAETVMPRQITVISD